MNLNLDSAVPSEIKKFWTSSINKETPTIVAIFFTTEANKAQKNIVLSGYVTDNYGSFDRLEMINDEANQKADLNCMEEETDSRMILYFANAKAEGLKNVLVLSNDSDVVTYLSAYFDQFETKNVKKIWVKYGFKECQRHITIHRLADILDSGKSRAFLKIHILTILRARIDPNYHPSTQN